jgi:hypothetical protein
MCSNHCLHTVPNAHVALLTFLWSSTTDRKDEKIAREGPKFTPIHC